MMDGARSVGQIDPTTNMTDVMSKKTETNWITYSDCNSFRTQSPMLATSIIIIANKRRYGGYLMHLRMPFACIRYIVWDKAVIY